MISIWYRLNKLLLWLVAILPLCALCYSQAVAETADTSLLLNWTFESNDQGSMLGSAVSSAGHVNDDSFGDIVIGAPKASSAVGQSGLAYVFYGTGAGPDTTPDVTLAGTSKGELFGSSVGAAGDVNGDGYDDVAIGAPGLNLPDNKLSAAGAFYLYYGKPSGLQSTAALTVTGEADNDRLGTAVAGAGDIDHDGYDDVLVGVPQATSSENPKGQVRVYFGSPAGLLTTTTEIQILEGNLGGAWFGYAVAGAGDINGDDYADVIVGAPHYDHDGAAGGAAFLFLGSEDGLIEPAAWFAYGSQPAASAGLSLAYGATVGAAGDANGDGYDDWFVSAGGYDGAYVDEGRVQVFHGRATADLAAAMPAWTHTGGLTGAQFGAGAGSAGDVNDDGFSDLIVGTPYYLATPDGDPSNEPEAAFVYLGSPSGLRHLHAWKLTCNQSTTDFGIAVGSAGDTDNDGYDDLLVGAPRYKHNTTIYGRAFGYAGVEGDGVSFDVYLPLVIKLP